MGVGVTITQSHVTQLINVRNEVIFSLNTKNSSINANLIEENLFLNSDDFGKVKNMKIPYRLLFIILIGCLIPREGSTYQIYWVHRYFI